MNVTQRVKSRENSELKLETDIKNKQQSGLQNFRERGYPVGKMRGNFRRQEVSSQQENNLGKKKCRRRGRQKL